LGYFAHFTAHSNGDSQPKQGGFWLNRPEKYLHEIFLNQKRLEIDGENTCFSRNIVPDVRYGPGV
jgi:hypothetical protein